MWRSSVLACVLAFGFAGRASARPDFAFGSSEWNGASRFLAIAREEAPDVRIAAVIPLDELDPNDAIVILAPDRPLPEDDLVEFVRRGGRIIIADDFGTAGPLLTRFGIRRTEPLPNDAPRVRGQDELLVARAFYAHPLTEGVGLVVTNRPTVLEHPRLVALLGFAENAPGVLVTGVVGDGRVVALGDPSVLLNTMMELGGNQRLARNLVQFATEGTPRRRLFVAGSETRFEGSFDAASRGTLRERTEAAIRGVAETRLPNAALHVAAASLAGLALLLLGSLRDRRVEPELPWLDPGTRGRSVRGRAADSLHDGLQLAVARRLGIVPGSGARDRRRAVQALRLPPDEERRMLRALETLASRQGEDLSLAELREAAHAFETAVGRRTGTGKHGS